jgi:hypothetical protein
VPLIIPTQSLASQQLQCQVAQQSVTLKIYQFNYGLFMDVVLTEGLGVNGVICLNRNRIVRNTYLGLVGDFGWIDTQGDEDPIYTGLGSRFLLLYLSEQDLLDQGLGE